MNNIKIKNIPEFRKTLNEITDIPEMSLSPYILKSDMNLTESEYRTKYLFKNSITISDFKALVDFLNSQVKENISEIENAKNEEQITGLINKLVSLTSFNNKEIGLEKINSNMETDKILKVEKEGTMKKSTVNKKETTVIEKQKPESKMNLNSVFYTPEKAEAFNYITRLLKISPSSKQHDKLPIASSHFYYLKLSKRNGKDFSISGNTIIKMSDYFSKIINITYKNLSSEEQDKLRESFETFSGQSLPKLDTVPAKKPSVKKEDAMKESIIHDLKPLKREKLDKTDNKKETTVIEKQKPESKININSVFYTPEKAEAFNNITRLLKISPSSKQHDKLPIASSHFYYLKLSKRNGKDFSISGNTIIKMSDYFSKIINITYKNLSSEEQDKLRESFETFSGQSLPKLNTVPAKKPSVKKEDAMKESIIHDIKPLKREKLEKTDNKKETTVTEKQKPEIKINIDSVFYSPEKAEAFKYITGLLKISPSSKQHDKLPIASSHFYYLKLSKRNGKDFSISVNTIIKMSNYFSKIIIDTYYNLSSEEQDKLRESFETFSGQSFPKLNTVPAKKQTAVKVKEEEAKIKPDNRVLSKSTLLTIKASTALKNLCDILKLKSHYYEKDGVPISVYTLFYWKKQEEMSVSYKKLLHVLDYFRDIIKNGNTKNLSDEDWKKVKQNWELFNSEVTMIKDKEVKQEIVDTPVSEEIFYSNEEGDETEFVLNYRYYIQKKQESDKKLEEILERRIQERENRDRLLKIQDALKDIPVLSTLALSKEKQFNEKVYEVKDFVISNKRGKSSVSEDMNSVDFVSENPEVSSSNNKIYLNEDEYKQYKVIKAEAEKDQVKVEVKLILGTDGKLNLYFCFSY